MAQDHYIAQTYLKHFGDDGQGGMLHAYRKSGAPPHPCWPKDVCREWDGDLNPRLSDPELLGEFRDIFEPHWNESIERILSGEMTPHDKFVVSGYLANLMTCTPTWRRVCVKVHNDLVKGYLSFSRRMKAKHGGMPELPADAIEAMERGEITLNTDPDYIKALVTRQVLDIAVTIYQQNWLIIRHDTDQPFVTSDNPVAMWDGIARKTRFLPITPQLCLAVEYGNVNLEHARLTPEEVRACLAQPPRGRIRTVQYNKAGVKVINRLVAQCAEEFVFSPAASSGIEALVKKYAKYRVDAEYVELPGAPGEDAIYRGTIIRVRAVA